jgi:hypothetical protein
VVVHRRQLPIVGRCEDFVPPPGATDEGGFCERCHKQVHDVSAMHEPELRRFLAARVGTRVCLSYRTDDAGRLRLRPEPAAAAASGHATHGPHPWAVGALALLLAACAGHMNELDAPGSLCHDADGYAVSCPSWPEPGMHSVPDGSEPVAARPPDAEGCPVRPTAEAPGDEPPIELAPIADAASEPADAPVLDEPEQAPDDAAPGAQGTTAKPRVNFSVDPDRGHHRGTVGIVVVSPGHWEDRDFVPTKDLWKEWRERRAERKAARQRFREHQRAVTSR